MFRLEHYSHGYGNKAERRAIAVDAVVSSFDESLEACAQRNLDSAADVPAEVVLRPGVASAQVRARPIETNATDCIRRERYPQRQLVLQVPGKGRNVDVAAAALEPKLVVCRFRAHRQRHQLRLVPHRYGDIVAGVGRVSEIARRERNPAGGADLGPIVTLRL